jgi:hypothetical protein
MPSTALHLGLQPEPLRVLLTAGSDFSCTLRLNEDWPVGTTLTLVSESFTWTATISGTDATFIVDKATTDTVVDGTAIKLVYANGTTDQVWALGTVVRTDG